MKIVMNRFGFAAPAFAALILASGILSAGAASNTGGGPQPDDCNINLSVCQKSCKNEGDWCWKDCESKFMSCKPGKSKSGSGPFSPKTGNHTSPTDGTKADPKKPPKVNDARAPLGGGVFQAKATKAGGASAPIQKPNGVNGPSFRSTNGRR